MYEFSKPAIPISELKAFRGPILKTMPTLLEGEVLNYSKIDFPRIPLSVFDVVEYRVRGENEQDAKLLNAMNVTTADVIIERTGSPELVVARYSDPLVKQIVDGLNPEIPITNTEAVSIDDEVYHAIRDNAFVFTLDIGGKYVPVEGLMEFLLNGDSSLEKEAHALARELSGDDPHSFPGYISVKPVQFRSSGLRLLNLSQAKSSTLHGSDGMGLASHEAHSKLLVGKVTNPPPRLQVYNVFDALGRGEDFQYGLIAYKAQEK